jgi:hypothetical protein
MENSKTAVRTFRRGKKSELVIFSSCKVFFDLVGILYSVFLPTRFEKNLAG